jgi:hypothetical protein
LTHPCGIGSAAKYAAAALFSSGVVSFANPAMVATLAFLGSAVLRNAFLKSYIC